VTGALVDAAARALERRTSRRGLLVRVAIIGSAVAVGPLRYLLRPGTALAVVTCSSCHGGRCCDGWTTFCCTINNGVNACPAYTYMAGWWKCTNYTGTNICHAQGVRYYIDCNRRPGDSCPHGCSCANGSCVIRSRCCNVFRYGQCNTQVGPTTEVVCRVIKCSNPCVLYPGTCSCTSFVDNNTCSHDSPCLKTDVQAAPYTGLRSGGGGGYG
jgi:hypothetical protein